MSRPAHVPVLGMLVLVIVLAWAGSAWLQGRAQQRWITALQQRARPGDLQLLSSQACVYCDRARSWLSSNAIPFDECFIESDARCLQQYQATGEQGTPTVLVQGRVQLGFDPQQVAVALGAAP